MVQVDPQEVMRRMQEQRGWVARLMNWLNQCPDARQKRGGGEPPVL
jgi:hypothetical protein